MNNLWCVKRTSYDNVGLGSPTYKSFRGSRVGWAVKPNIQKTLGLKAQPTKLQSYQLALQVLPNRSSENGDNNGA